MPSQAEFEGNLLIDPSEEVEGGLFEGETLSHFPFFSLNTNYTMKIYEIIKRRIKETLEIH